MDDDVVRAELLSLPWQLSLALAEAPFILEPHSALSLPVRAKAAAERAMRLATVRDRTTTRTLPQLLANRGGAVNRLLKSALKGIDGKELAGSEELSPREFKAELADVVEKLASFQISRFRTQDFKLALLLAERCVYPGDSSRGSSERLAAVTRSVRAFRDWMREAVNVLEEAWWQHRVKIDVDLIHEGEGSRQHLCYSKAPKLVGSDVKADVEELLKMFPIPRWALLDEDTTEYDEFMSRWRSANSSGGIAEGVPGESSDNVIDLLESGRDGVGKWFLSPRVAESLYLRLSGGCDYKILEEHLPRIAKPYCKNIPWMENLQQCRLRLSARLKKGIVPRPNCTGENVALYIEFDDELSFEIYNAFTPGSFESECDSVELLEDHLMKDINIIKMLFDEAFDYENRFWEPLFRMCNLHPAEWFKPFDPDRFHDHIIISRECRPEKVEHAIAVLSKARRPLHDRLLLSKIVAYLDDSDIIRLTCCGKANGA